MRPLAFEISQRESVSTLHRNVSLIERIATDSFVAYTSDTKASLRVSYEVPRLFAETLILSEHFLEVTDRLLCGLYCEPVLLDQF